MGLKRPQQFGIFSATVILLLLLNSGCAPPRKIYAKYTLPPSGVADFLPLKNAQIEKPSVEIRGNFNTQAQKAAMQNYIRERLAGLIYKERFYNVSDDIYRNITGESQLQQVLRGHHGYDLIHSYKPKTSKIMAKAVVNIERKTGEDLIETQLVNQPYKTEYRKNKEGYSVPHAVPNYDRKSVRKRQDRVPYIKISATAQLNITIFGKNGEKRYERLFKNLKFHKKVGGSGDIAAVPTSLEIAASLFNDSIVATVKDISPHTETRLLEVNVDGDKTAVVLIKATAFSEAVRRLDKVIEQNEAEYQAMKRKIEEEYQREVEEIKASSKEPLKKKAAIEKLEREKTEELAKERAPLSPDYENYALCMEVMGYLDDAIECFEKAHEADQDNQTAKDAHNRVLALREKAKGMPRAGEKMKRRHDYKQKEHKER